MARDAQRDWGKQPCKPSPYRAAKIMGHGADDGMYSQRPTRPPRSARREAVLIYGRDMVTDPGMTSGSNCCPVSEVTGNVSL